MGLKHFQCFISVLFHHVRRALDVIDKFLLLLLFLGASQWRRCRSTSAWSLSSCFLCRCHDQPGKVYFTN